MFLILVDGYTRWVKIKLMNFTDAERVIRELKVTFGMFDDPEVVVADNGPPFQSKSFRDFLEDRDIKFINSPRYHPQSNGLAERNVRTVKTYLKKTLLGSGREPVKHPEPSTSSSGPQKDDVV